MKVGSKVICIDDSIPSHLNMEQFHNDFHQWIKKDEIYTIREILTNDGLVTSVLLEEVKNPIRFFKHTIGRFQESSFRIDRFREMEDIDIKNEFLSEEEVEELMADERIDSTYKRRLWFYKQIIKNNKL